MLRNRKSKFNFKILDKEIAGIELKGTELKPLRNGKASISEAYVYIIEEENSIYIKNMYISSNEKDAYSHDPYRIRKLLLTKKQMKKWVKEIRSGGKTIVPIFAFFNKRNIFKIEIGLAKGKKVKDKRNDIKERELKRKIKKYV